MRLTLTTDDGELLDAVTISGAEFRAETDNHPTGILAQLQPGDDALDKE